MRIWQIAAGDGARDYSQLFLKYDVMLMSPGSFGDYGERKEAYQKVPKAMVDQIANFYAGPQAQDVVLLRKGKRVIAIGKIPESPQDQYHWNPVFGDVLGWDSEHCRRVQWEEGLLPMLDPHQTATKPLFDNYKQQRTFTRVHEPRIHGALQGIAFQVRELHPLPTLEATPLSAQALGEELFAAGLANDSVERVQQAIERIRRLSLWYENQADKKRPSEHEIVAHMIAPLMLGLGWSEQLMPIEWNKVDVAFFDRPPLVHGNYDNCIMICEAKGRGSDLESAYAQALGYVRSLGLHRCKRIVTTDGGRLFIYRRPDTGWQDDLQPSGYVNLASVRRENVFPFGTSGVQTLIEMIPLRAMR